MPSHIPLQLNLREFALGITFVTIIAFVHTWAYQDERIAEAEYLSRTLQDYSAIYAQCLNGDVDILWHEPHSGKEMATQCRTVVMGRIR